MDMFMSNSSPIIWWGCCQVPTQDTMRMGHCGKGAHFIPDFPLLPIYFSPPPNFKNLPPSLERSVGGMRRKGIVWDKRRFICWRVAQQEVAPPKLDWFFLSFFFLQD